MRALRWAALAAASILAVACGESSPVASGAVVTPPLEPPPPPPRIENPSFVLIMTDDQALSDMSAMPLVRQVIGEEGVTFNNAFASWPLCCPSRATAFTGQYAHNHAVLGNYAPDGGHQAFDDAETLPVWLQRAGYTTVHIGKYLNGYGAGLLGQTYVPPGWTDWLGMVDPSTYRMWGYTVNHNGILTTYGDYEVEDPALYQTDVLTGLALDAIDDLALAPAPFFLSVAFLAPHEEIAEAGSERVFPGPRSAPRHRGMFAGTPLPQPPNYNEEDLSDKPPVIEQFGRRFTQTPEANAQRYENRLESLIAVDEAVQAIVDRLAALGRLDDTYIVFTSDNGWFNGEHHIPLGKHLMYEPSIRVPLLVRGPGIPAGRSTDELVVNADLAATFVDLAQAETARVIDGRSLFDYAADPSLRSDRPILLDAPHNQIVQGSDGTTVDVPSLIGLRTTQYTYVEYGTGEVELYDLAVDPYQLESRHADPVYQLTRTALHQALMQYQGCAGASCRADLSLPLTR